MLIYNRMAASAYATTWAKGRNPLWADDSGPTGGGYCTNFVSQALYAGGWVMCNNTDPRLLVRPPWYSKMFDYTRQDRSKSWASAHHFSLFLSWSGRARPCLLPEITIGDILQEFLHGNDYPSHTMMVTRVLNGQIYLSYHSRDYMNTLLDDVIKRSVSGSQFTFWKINDVYES